MRAQTNGSRTGPRMVKVLRETAGAHWFLMRRPDGRTVRVSVPKR